MLKAERIIIQYAMACQPERFVMIPMDDVVVAHHKHQLGFAMQSCQGLTDPVPAAVAVAVKKIAKKNNSRDLQLSCQLPNAVQVVISAFAGYGNPMLLKGLGLAKVGVGKDESGFSRGRPEDGAFVGEQQTASG